MALHNLKITVIDGGSAGGSGIFKGSDDAATNTGEKSKKTKDGLLYKILNYNATMKDKLKQSTSPTAAFAIMAGVQLVRQTGREILNYYVSDIGISSGDSNYQSIVQRKIEVASDVMSVGQGALGGAAAGSTFGVYGALIGAAVGAVGSGISLGFKYSGRYIKYTHEVFKENNSQAYQLSRANFNIYTGRGR